MWNIIVFAILLNALASLFLRKTPLKGLDAMPAFPVFAGYLYGPSAGITAGAVIAAAYYVFNVRSVHYAPLTIAANMLIGFLASLLAGIDILIAGTGLLLVYHVISGLVVSVFGGLKPGYFAFVMTNIATSAAIFYISSFVL